MDNIAKAVNLGELGTAKTTSRWTEREWLRQLRGTRGLKTYREMKDNDDILGAILFAIRYLSRQVSWTIEAHDDTPQSAERAEFVHQCLFEDLNLTWSDQLSEILSMLWAGFSVFEMVYKIRGGDVRDPTRKSKFSDGKIGWRKWGVRPQDTLIDGAISDAQGGLQGFRQQGISGPPVILPIEKLLLFRTEAEGGSPFGRSIFRNCFIDWYYKKNIQQIEGIGIERDLAGYPTFQQAPPVKDGPMPPDLWNKDDPKMTEMRNLLENAVRLIKRDEQEGMVLPWWIEFKLVSTGSRRAFDTGAVIQRLDSRMAMTTLADFILLGSDKVGSFALSKTKTSLFSIAIDGFLDAIEAVINRFAIPQLYRVNGWPAGEACQVHAGAVEQINLEELSNYINRLTGAGVPLFPNQALEQYLLSAARLPEPTEDERTAQGTRFIDPFDERQD